MSGDRFTLPEVVIVKLDDIKESVQSNVLSKLDGIKDDVSEIKIHVAKHAVILEAQHEQLKEHIKRTNLLEQKLEPVEKHVARVDGALRLLGGIAAAIAALAGLVKIAQFFLQR